MSYLNLFSQYCEIATENIEEILTYFEIDYRLNSNTISLKCPIHDGDRDYSLSIKLGDQGIWKCWTKHCEEDDIDGKARGKNMLGLIRSLLSLNKEKVASYKEAIEWLKQFTSTSDLLPIDKDQDKEVWTRFNKLNTEEKEIIVKVSRSQIRSNLKIPAQYFINRGFSSEILDKYDVGLCVKKDKPMTNRVVVPIYDENYDYVGCAGRTIFPQCPNCDKYHSVKFDCGVNFPKWKFSGKSGDHLFNLCFAKDYINKCNTAILAEGQMDVLRLEEAGIHIGLGIFGSDITDTQKKLLFNLQLNNIIILTDNDEAGHKARQILHNKLGRMYNLYDLMTKEKDVGDTPIKEVQELVNPLLSKL